LPSEWKTHKLIWRNKADLEEQSIDDLFNSLKIYETEVKQSSSTSTATQNLAFVSSSHTDSTTDSIDIDDLEEMDLRWQMAMLTIWARRKDYFARECRFSKDPRRPGSYDWSYQVEEKLANFALMAFSSSSSDNETGLEYVEARLLVYKQNESVFEENIKLLNIKVQLRDTALATLRQKLDKAEKDRDALKLKLEKFQTSSKNLTELLASQTKSDCESWPHSSLYDRFQPSGGYHAVPPSYIGTFMPPKPDLIFNTALTTIKTDHLTFNQIETTILAATPVPASPNSNSSGQRRNRKACFICKSVDHLIKDFDFHTKKMAQPTQRNYAHRGHHKQPVSATLPNITLTRPRHAHHVITKLKSPIIRHITRSPSLKTNNSPPRVTAVQAPMVSAAQGKHGIWVWRPKCPILDHDFQTTSASMTLKQFYYIDALARSKVPRENNMYNVNLKNIVPSGHLTCLFAKATIDESNLRHRSRLTWVFFLDTKDETSPILKTFITGLENQLSLKGIKREFIIPRTPQQNGIAERKNKTLIEVARTMLVDSLLPIPFWAEAVNTTCYVQNRVLVTKPHNQTPYELLHGRTPSIGFMRPFGCPVTILNTLDPLGKFQGKVDDGFLVGYSVWDEVDQTYMLFPVCSVQSKEQDDKTKKEAKGKSHVESVTRYRDLNAEFEDYSKNSNGSQLPDDPNMPELENIAYSDDEDVVGADADFNNLESSTLEEPKRVYQALKDLNDERQVSDRFYGRTYILLWSLGKSASTPIDIEKPLLKDPNGEDVDGKDDLRYLKGKPHLGLWYPKDSPFDLVAYSDSDYVGASLDRKSATGGCQFLGYGLISWQCKKQTVVATSSTEAEYVAAASCCAQVLWI
nr:hypothetical protein [Tanacetum cinerariifolium]